MKPIQQLSKNRMKFLTSLQTKKHREEEKLFVAEGPKIAREILSTGKRIHSLYCLAGWLDSQNHHDIENLDITVVSNDEMRKISTLVTPQEVLCVVHQFEHKLDEQSLNKNISLALDGIQDPGNMGTILRLADWFGIDTVLCSTGCVDVYNPKVVQASMGALCRVNIHAVDLPSVLSCTPISNGTPVYGTFLDGENIYTKDLSPAGIIVLGNEGNGISEAVAKRVTHRLHIPSFREGGAVESLNVSVAAAIVCSEFARRNVANTP